MLMLFLCKYAGQDSHPKGHGGVSFTLLLSHLANAKWAGTTRVSLWYLILKVLFPTQTHCHLTQLAVFSGLRHFQILLGHFSSRAHI